MKRTGEVMIIADLEMMRVLCIDGHIELVQKQGGKLEGVWSKLWELKNQGNTIWEMGGCLQ